MVRLTHHLTDQQVKALKTLSKQTGIPVPELIRRAIDLLLKQQGG